jgi:hypothetical protein
MSYTRLRLRADFFEPVVVGVEDYIFYTGENIFHNKFVKTPFAGQDVVASERCYDELHHGPPYTSGGPFESWKSQNPWNQVQGAGLYKRKIGLTTYQWNGGFLPTSFGSGQLSYQHLKDVGIKGLYGPNWGEISSYGATAYNRFRPKTSGFDGATALGELRDLPGMLKNASKKFDTIFRGMGGSRKSLIMPKALGDHYLETVFGWVPFLSDLSKMYNTYQNMKKILNRLKRQNNQWIKKGGSVLQNYTVTDREETFDQNSPFVTPTLVSGMYDYPYSGKPGKFGNSIFETQTETDIWFEGSFKYYIPDISDFGASHYSQIRNYMQVFGLRISPSLVWNLTPWSWLADWMGNFGDVIDNVTAAAQDRLVTRYAYLMGRSRLKRFNSSTIHLCGQSINCMWHQRAEVKRRESASPFGFHLKVDDFSTSQWAILTALGLSKGRI